MTIAGTLGQLITQTRDEDLPPLAFDHAAMLISSTIAAAAMGYEVTSSRIVRGLTKEQGGTPQSSLWFDGAKVPANQAARTNALTSDASASDDSDLRTTMHSGTNVTATTLAIAEVTGASGREVLAAMALGYEVAGRIADGCMPEFKKRGYHHHNIVCFASTVAAGRLLKLDAQQMAQAICLAAISMGGLIGPANTEMREYYAGNAAMLGINAVHAAQRGYLGDERALEMKDGFFSVYGAKDPEFVIRDWGSQWAIVTEMAVKILPGGHPYHAFAEAAINAAVEGNVAVDQVESITMARPADKELRPPSHPKNMVDLAHCGAYYVAAGIADRDFGWQHASPEKIADPVIHALIDKIKVGEPVTDNVERFKLGARVTIKTKDGRSYTSTVYAPKGSAVRGITWADIDYKYRTLLPMVLDKRKMEDSLKVIHAFRDVKNVAELIGILLR